MFRWWRRCFSPLGFAVLALTGATGCRGTAAAEESAGFFGGEGKLHPLECRFSRWPLSPDSPGCSQLHSHSPADVCAGTPYVSVRSPCCRNTPLLARREEPSTLPDLLSPKIYSPGGWMPNSLVCATVRDESGAGAWRGEVMGIGVNAQHSQECAGLLAGLFGSWGWALCVCGLFEQIGCA